MPQENKTPKGLLDKYPWIIYLLPFVVFGIGTAFEPTPKTVGGAALGMAIPYHCYPWIYTAKIVLTTLSVLLVLPGYRQFPFKVNWLLSLAVGVIGVVAWIGLCKLDIERNVLGQLGLGKLIDLGARSSYDPFEQIADPVWAWGFLAVRLFGFAIVVSIIEEFFIRGFLMRFLVDQDWWEVPFGKVNTIALVAGTAVPMLMHPAELLAAAVWFSAITWLMLKTRNIWDCVVAHAMTNLLLGVYVVSTPGNWHLM